MIVITFMYVWLSSSWCDEWLCRLRTTVWFSSSCCSVYLCLDDSNEQSIYDKRQEIKLMVVNILQNWSQRYSSHNNNIKCIDSSIKCISFESFHYAINLDVVS